jgi:hypothetical protein
MKGYILVILLIVFGCKKDDPAPNPLIGNWEDGYLVISYPNGTKDNYTTPSISFTETTLLWEDGKTYSYKKDGFILNFTPHLFMDPITLPRVQFSIEDHSWGTDLVIIDLDGRAADGDLRFKYTWTKVK